MNSLDKISVVIPNQSMAEQENEVVIDIKGLVYAIWKRWWIIILVCVIGAYIGYISIDQTVRVSYSANITLSVTSNPGEDRQLSVSDITAADKLIPNYIELLTNSQVLDKIATVTGLDYDSRMINSMLSTSTVEDTNIFKIMVTGDREEEVSQVADAVVQTAPKALTDILTIGSIKVIDDIELSKNVYTNNPVQNTVIGGFVGGMLVCIIICGLELIKNPIRNEKDIENAFGITSLGRVPKFKVKKRRIKNSKGRKMSQKNSENISLQELS